MNWLDIVLLALIAGSVISGFTSGFVRVGIGLAALFVGLLCALWFYPVAGAWIGDWIDSRNAANFMGFMLIFVGILVLGGLLASVLARLLRLAGLSWLDRIGGAGLGFVRGVLVGVVVLLVMTAFSTGTPASMRQSKLAPYVIQASDVIAAMAPRELKDGFEETYERLKKAWADMQRHGPRAIVERF